MCNESLKALIEWYEKEESERYVICAGLAVLERAKKTFPLKRSDYITKGNQVRTSGPLIKKILARYGETRTFASEGGRTTRGTVPAAERLVGKLNSVPELQNLSQPDRVKIFDQLQAWLVDKVKEYFDKQKIEVEIQLDKPSPKIIWDILSAAEEKKLKGAVAQHLVGAKLALRFPDIEIENHSYTTSDQQLGRQGDFLVGDTVFHVTVAPMPQVIEKCDRNIKNGYRAILLVPENKLQGTNQMIETMELSTKVGVFSIESFVGQNIEEMGRFGKNNLARGLRKLLEKYNERVQAVETNRSLLIEIPSNL